MAMPSLDFLKSGSGAATEVLRIESEPPGADARTTQGQTCRTPCELSVPTATELAVTVAMNGYQSQTLPVRVDGGGGDSRLQPNPLYVELQPAAPVKPEQPAPAPKKKNSAAAPATAPKTQAQAAAPVGAAPKTQAEATPAPTASYPASTLGAGYPWPPPPQ
jgi:hypothetical protein